MPVKRRCSLRKLFDAIDTDGSGEVTLAEVTKAFKKAAGKDELLTYNEFSKMCRKYGGRSAVDNDMAVIYQLFAKLDTDGNGYISIDEFFDEDKDGNGLSLEEFLKNFGSMTADQLRVATKLFEKISKGDGTISREDFKAAAGDDEKLTKAELHKVYNANSGFGFRGSAAGFGFRGSSAGSAAGFGFRGSSAGSAAGFGFRGSAARPFRGSAARPFRGSAARPLRGSAARPFRGSAARPFRGSAARPFRGSAARGGCM